jgi:hypothetical protein
LWQSFESGLSCLFIENTIFGVADPRSNSIYAVLRSLINLPEDEVAKSFLIIPTKKRPPVPQEALFNL